MGATYSRRGKRSFLITVHCGGERERRTIHGTEKDAKDLVQHINRQELAGINVVAALRSAATPTMPARREWPRLRDALPEFIRQMGAQGEWTGSTPINYGRRLQGYVYDFALPDGRKLGDLAVDQVTEQMIGAVLDRARTSGANGARAKSLATQEQIRSPLRRFYRDLIRKHGFTGPNPADDLGDYMSKNVSKRARHGRMTYFSQEEGPQLFGTCTAGYPRWLAFVGCCTLAGLRWGEAAALEREDIDWKAGVIHVRRSICDKTAQVKVTKDGEDRYVPMSPQLATWLREHLAAIVLKGQVNEWTPEQRALVFPNSRGRIGQYSTFLEHVWRPVLLKAGLRYRKAHSMRHTFATWAIEGNEEKGIPPGAHSRRPRLDGPCLGARDGGLPAPESCKPCPRRRAPRRVRERVRPARRRARAQRPGVTSPPAARVFALFSSAHFPSVPAAKRHNTPQLGWRSV